MAKPRRSRLRPKPPSVKRVAGKTKTCRDCGRVYPATPEYFRRYNIAPDGLQPACKWCATDLVKQHYIKFTRMELVQKGPLGVICPLWNHTCGICREAATCWRLNGSDPDDLPWSLRVLELEERVDKDDADEGPSVPKVERGSAVRRAKSRRAKRRLKDNGDESR